MAKNSKEVFGRLTALPQAPRGEKMNKARELSILLTLQAEGETGRSIPCGYCEELTELPSMTCTTLNVNDGWFLGWSCSKCTKKFSSARRAKFKRVQSITEEQVDANFELPPKFRLPRDGV